MIRKNIRLRREYLFSKEQEKQNMEEYEKKYKIRKAQENNTKVPTELYKEEKKLKKKMELEDDSTAIPRSIVDDEYNVETSREPAILLTTSRDASSRLSQFLKEMKLIFPNSERLNRGSYVINDLVNICLKKEFTDLVILHEHRGEPDGMIISHMPYGPTIYFGISNTVLRHDLPEKPDTVSEAYPHLIFNNFSTKLGERVTKILKHLFAVPKFDSKRIITFSNSDDTISFRHHTYTKPDFKTVELNEIGPRFEMKPYQIVLGTINMPEAQKEWVLRPYMNTATKRKAL
mmetsp:Transcript_50434/g.58028  ORF Transcript_50434/g.58028 Transcript_50434/m.58028 type:complete len:289 (+) Transcript_50434:25-891(+)